MAGKETPPPKRSLRDEMSFFIGAWTALNYATGFAATVAAIPVDLGIDVVRGVRWATGHRSPPVEGQEPLGCFPLTGEVAAHMRQVGQTIDLVGLLGLCSYGMLVTSINSRNNPVPVEATQHVYVTPVPLDTETPAAATVPGGQEANPTPVLTWSQCITIGSGENEAGTAFGAWGKLGKPQGSLVFRDLAGPGAKGDASAVTPATLPRIVNPGDELCK